MNRLLALYWKFERYVIVLVLLMSFSLQSAKSQDSLQVTSPKTKIIRMDSLTQDTTSIVKLKHSPTKAALLSAVLPGLGQIYNKKYWKLPIVYAGVAISAYFLIDNQRKYTKYNDALVNYSNTGDINTVNGLTELPQWVKDEGRLKIEWGLGVISNGYRRQRDWSFVALTATYVLGILDAAVDAYLFDYDISDKLTMSTRPMMINTIAGTNAFGLKLSFNLH